MRNIRFLPIVLSVALFSVFVPLDIYAPWMIMLFCLLAGILGISCLPDEEDRRFLYKIFVIGYILRIFGSVFFYLMTCGHPRFPGFFIADSWVYSANAVKIAERLQHGLPVIGAPRSELWSESGGIHYYDYLNGGIYFFLGDNPLIMFFLNCFFGILAALFIYFITLSVSNRNAARLASALCAFWPSLFLWSTQNLKEPVTVLFVVLSIWAFVFFLKKANPCYLVVVFASLRFLAIFRPPLDKIVLVSLVLHLFFFGLHMIRRKPVLFFLVIPAFVLAAGSFGQIFAKWMEQMKDINSIVTAGAQMIDNLRSARTTASLALLPGYKIISLSSLLCYMPIGVSVVLLAPFPWQVFSASQIMALPEMLVWYLMIPYFFKGLYVCVKKKFAYIGSALTYSVLMLLMLSFIEGNIGTMFRHRSMVMIFLLMFAALGIDAEPERKAVYAS